MINENLGYDEISEEKYSKGKWYVFPIKGVLSPCNDWMQSLAKLPLTSKMFISNEIVSIISEMKWKYYAGSIFWREFILLLIMTGVFLIDIFWLHYREVNENTKAIAGYIFNCLIALILFRFILTEIT